MAVLRRPHLRARHGQALRLYRGALRELTHAPGLVGGGLEHGAPVCLGVCRCAEGGGGGSYCREKERVLLEP